MGESGISENGELYPIYGELYPIYRYKCKGENLRALDFPPFFVRAIAGPIPRSE